METTPPPIINLSIIEEEEKPQFEHTNAQYSNSDNENRRNFSGLQEDFFRGAPPKLGSSTHSLKQPISSNKIPKIQKKPSLDAKAPAFFAANREKPEEIPFIPLPELKLRSQSEMKKLSFEDKISTNARNPGSERKERDSEGIPSDSLIRDRASSNNFAGFSSKNPKFLSEMKNFTRKKWTLVEFETIIREFFEFGANEAKLDPKGLTEHEVLQVFSEIWLFFFQAVQILMYLHKETKAQVMKLKKNFKDSQKIRRSFNKYQKTASFEEFVDKRSWKGYLDETQKNVEIFEEMLAKLEFLATFLEGFLGKTYELDAEHAISEVFLEEKAGETFAIFENELKNLNNFAGLSSFSEERLQILAKIEKKESFLNFLEFFTADVKKRHQQDLKSLIICFLLFFKKLSQICKAQAQEEKTFRRNIHETCIGLSELLSIFTKKTQNLLILKKSACDQLSAIVLPFFENFEKNLEVLSQTRLSFSTILKKIAKIQRKVRFSRESFPNNFFLNLRESHAAFLLQQLRELRDSLEKQVKLLPFFEEFANYEQEISKIESICARFQEDFESNEEKPRIRDKVVFLAGKLHNLRVFYHEMQENHCADNALLQVLQSQLATQLTSSYKFYDFLLKMLNSAHSSELQRIKIIERDVDRVFEVLFRYYETLSLPKDWEISEKLQEMRDFKHEIDSFSMLVDLPDIYKDICSTKSSELEQEIEKLVIFEEIRCNGREKLDNNRVRNAILSLKYEKKCVVLEELLAEFDKIRNISKFIAPMHASVKSLVERVHQIFAVLQVFQTVYAMFFEKFQQVSEKYEELKRFVAGYRETLLRKVENALENSRSGRHELQFFLQCAEFFFINTKNFFQTLIPENTDHIYSQTSHFLREIRGKIDNFYENRENLKVMAVGYTRQLNIIKTIAQYLEILEKLRDQQSQKLLKTREHLLNLKEIVETMLKPCEVAYLFEEFLENLTKNKNMRLEERIEKVKTMLKELNEKLKNMELQEKTLIKDEKIASIYVYVKDDIKKVNGFISVLVPDIEEFAQYQALMDQKLLRMRLDEENMRVIEKIHAFKHRIFSNNDANQPIVFHDRNKINEFIQQYYFHWYGNIQRFFQNFDFHALDQIIKCYKCVRNENLLRVSKETEGVFEKIAVLVTKNKKPADLEAKNARLQLNSLKNELQQVELSVFTLQNLEIRHKFAFLNKIEDLEAFLSEMQEKFAWDEWKDLVYDAFALVDKYCMGESAIQSTIYKSFRKKFEEKSEKGWPHYKKWAEIMLKVFV